MTDAVQSASALWELFKEHRTAAVRERLAIAYLPLVRAQARQMARRVPASVKGDDLEGYGMIGLLEAIDRFDPDRGIPFEVFARLRVRGSIYDYLRTLDLLPRLARQQVRRVQVQEHLLIRRLGRAPTDPELGDATGMNAASLRRARADARAGMPLSLDEFSENDRLPEALARDAGGDVSGQIEQAARDAELWRAIELLPVRHKVVMGLYYCEGLTLGAIGRVLRVTESRVSQMRSEALQGLRTHLALRTWWDGEASGGRPRGTGPVPGAQHDRGPRADQNHPR
jgi:RNA polymerase sigma factor for flagellar operon FliA